MRSRILTIFASLSLTALVAGCSDAGDGKATNAAGAQAPAPTVGVITMKAASLPVTRLLPGRADSFQTADIRPRVSGILTEIPFKEGSRVRKGDLLYQIDDDSYAAAVAQAEAAVAKSEASVPSAEANLARYERLVNSGATQIEFENAKVTLLQAKADVASSEAALRAAQINLDLTKITAPFDGLIDQTAVNIGNVVTANQTDALTTVRQLDPIYIELTESSTNLLKLRAAIEAGKTKTSVAKGQPIRLTMEDGKEYGQMGTLDMSKMTVSETTGTFSIRVVFPNPELLILPGMYVRATVTLGEENGFLIPQLASTRQADGSLAALFVSADGKVETRLFKDAVASNNAWLVTEGVKDGDKLIISGLQSIGPGMAVQPVEMAIDGNGVVVEAEKKDPAPATQTN